MKMSNCNSSSSDDDYLNAFPHRRDGLSIEFLDPQNPAIWWYALLHMYW